jgi:hypothetical protein
VRAQRELRKEIIAARNGNLSWLTKAFIRTVHEIEYHDVVSSAIFTEEFPDKHPHEWTKQA